MGGNATNTVATAAPYVGAIWGPWGAAAGGALGSYMKGGTAQDMATAGATGAATSGAGGDSFGIEDFAKMYTAMNQGGQKGALAPPALSQPQTRPSGILSAYRGY